jgi:hypothetical protein
VQQNDFHSFRVLHRGLICIWNWIITLVMSWCAVYPVYITIREHNTVLVIKIVFNFFYAREELSSNIALKFMQTYFAVLEYMCKLYKVVQNRICFAIADNNQIAFKIMSTPEKTVRFLVLSFQLLYIGLNTENLCLQY